jgi:hypothetical protein
LDGGDLTGWNFGGAGTLAIAPASSLKGEFCSVVMFNLSNSVAFFNTNFGVGRWIICGISLKLTSNWGAGGAQPNNPIFNLISGGQFVIEWMANDDWVEGTGNPSDPTTDGVTWDSLPFLLSEPHVPLCTNTYVPPGVNVPVVWPLPLNPNLVADIANGGNVSFYFYAADANVGYLFNSYNYGRGNQPCINVAAIPLVEILSGAFTNGVFCLTGLGGVNATYQIQANTDLATTNWIAVGAATAGTNGVILFNDHSATNAQCFYRLSQ